MAAVLLRILRKKLEKFIANPSDLSWDISSGTVHAPALALNLDFVNSLLPACICVEALVIKDVHVKFSVTQIAKEPVVVSIGAIEIMLMELVEPRARPPSTKKKKEAKEVKPKKKSSFTSIAAAFIDGLRLNVQSINIRLSVLPLQPAHPAIIFEATGFSLSGANESYQPVGNHVYVMPFPHCIYVTLCLVTAYCHKTVSPSSPSKSAAYPASPCARCCPSSLATPQLFSPPFRYAPTTFPQYVFVTLWPGAGDQAQPARSAPDAAA